MDTSTSRRSGAGIYLPAWLQQDEYKRLGELPLKKLDRVILAFANLGPNGGLKAFAISRALGDLLYDLFNNGVEIYLAFGGWGHSDEDHAQLLEYWKQAARRAERFGKEVHEEVQGLERALHIEFAGIDMDWEYPGPKQGRQLTELIRQIRGAVYGRISVAVPPEGEDLRGYDAAMDDLLPLVDTWNVMTYDCTGSWSPVAGYHAPGVWTLDCAQAWVERAGTERVSMGFPTYGYVFPGTSGPGQKPTAAARPVMVSGLDLSKTVEDWEQLASGLVTDEGWVSFQSPAMVRAVRKRLAQDLGITQAFRWSAQGLNAEYLAALAD